MKRINALALAETNNLLARFEAGEFDKLYLPWAQLRQSFQIPATKLHWKETVRNMIASAKEMFDSKEAHRFYTNEYMNMQVQVFVMGGYNSEPFETSSSVVITLH
jgi:hypothetical protein